MPIVVPDGDALVKQLAAHIYFDPAIDLDHASEVRLVAILREVGLVELLDLAAEGTTASEIFVAVQRLDELTRMPRKPKRQ